MSELINPIRGDLKYFSQFVHTIRECEYEQNGPWGDMWLLMGGKLFICITPHRDGYAASIVADIYNDTAELTYESHHKWTPATGWTVATITEHEAANNWHQEHNGQAMTADLFGTPAAHLSEGNPS